MSGAAYPNNGYEAGVLEDNRIADQQHQVETERFVPPRQDAPKWAADKIAELELRLYAEQRKLSEANTKLLRSYTLLEDIGDYRSNRFDTRERIRKFWRREQANG